MVHVSLRERNGDLGFGLTVHYSDLDLALVQKRERAVILAGKDRGKMGTVTVSVLFDILEEVLLFFPFSSYLTFSFT